MTLYGLQKMTLLDFPGKVACTVFTGGCNFRCPFCHNATLVEHPEKGEILESREFLSFLDKRHGLLDGVCITGGEPLMRAETLDLMRNIRSLGFQVKLDTNGSYPDRLETVLREHLADYIAVDVKNCMEKYAETIGVPGYDTAKVERSIDMLIAGDTPFELRTTVVSEFHTVTDIEALAKRIAGTQHYYLQNFVDSGNLIGENLHGVSKETMDQMKKAAEAYLPNVGIRGI